MNIANCLTGGESGLRWSIYRLLCTALYSQPIVSVVQASGTYLGCVRLGAGDPKAGKIENTTKRVKDRKPATRRPATRKP